MVVWLDFKKATAISPKFVSAANVDQPINSDSVEISGGFHGQEGVKKQNKLLNY